jgi:hypothetical protein
MVALHEMAMRRHSDMRDTHKYHSCYVDHCPLHYLPGEAMKNGRKHIGGNNINYTGMTSSVDLRFDFTST